MLVYQILVFALESDTSECCFNKKGDPFAFTLSPRQQSNDISINIDGPGINGGMVWSLRFVILEHVNVWNLDCGMEKSVTRQHILVERKKTGC